MEGGATWWSFNGNTGGQCLNLLGAGVADLVCVQELQLVGDKFWEWHHKVRDMNCKVVAHESGEGPVGGPSGGVAIVGKPGWDVVEVEC